jgi:hypothetical protein
METPSAGPVTPARPTNTLALVSLVSGILAWVILPFLGAIVAIITGHMARREIRAAPESYSGEGMAIAGLILGYAQVVLIVLPLCCLVVLFLVSPGIGSIFSQILSSM